MTGKKHIPLTLGFSPCPNDTFIFHGLVSGKIQLPGYQVREELHDVETLNQMAFNNVLDVTKLSFLAWLMVKDRYQLLSSGGALGYGCGPVVIGLRPLDREDMRGCRIALPGEWTTAHLLLRLWAPRAAQRIFVPYDQIFNTLRSGEAECGVIIHESRFTFEKAGFRQVVDLGAWWEEQTGLPIPLGCIAAHERLDHDAVRQFDALIGQSIAMAQQNPAATLPYIRSHAQEMTESVLQEHIHTFVNEFSLDLGTTGLEAINTLKEKAYQAGILQ